MNATPQSTEAASASLHLSAKFKPHSRPHTLGITGQPAVTSRRKAHGGMTQCELLCQALEQGPRTTDELRCLGIYAVAQRVADLRKRGYAIAVEITPIVDRDGYLRHGVARYSMEAAPCAQAH